MSQQKMDHDEVAHAIHRNTEHHVSKLEQIREQLETNALDLAVGGSPNDRRVDDWPVPGRSRFSLSDRRVSGTDGLAIPAGVATLVLAALPGRAGGQVVNSGANPVILYLAEPGRAGAGIGAIWLSANGGSWDFRLGNVMWGGPISAISTNGTTLTIAQV